MANVIIIGIALLCGVALLAAILIGRTGLHRTVPLSLGLVLLACLWLPATAKIGLALSCLSGVFALYAAELCFAFGSPARHIGHFPTRPASFDIRSAFEVVTDLRSQGLDAHADLAGRLPLVAGRSSLPSGSGAILPLGGFSRRLIVFCNETGRYVTYRSDEYGFNNPAGIWARGPVSVAALGDSFAQGFCTAPEQTFVARIRDRFPGTLNLGMVGNGPLLELAALKEYVVAVKPRTVLWFYFEANDLQDLADEARNPLLMQYLEQPGFTQRLMSRQAEIDRAWTAYENHLLSAWRSSRAPGLIRPLADWLTDLAVEHKNRTMLARTLRLREIRGRLESRFRPVAGEEVQLPLLRRVLEQANTTIRSWGGSLHFVFLPGMDLLMNPGGRRAQLARAVLREVEGMDIPVIDVRDSFRPHAVASLFYYPDSHYNETGTEMVARSVLDRLDRAPAPLARAKEIE